MSNKPRKVCPICGKEFVAGRNHKTRTFPMVYCSKECQWESMRKKKPTEQEKAERREQKRRLRWAASLTRMMAKKEQAARVVTCRVCGVLFVTSQPNAVMCGPECRRKWDNTIRPEHRVRRNGEPDLTITLPRLFKRDAGVCAICGEPCDWDDYKVIGHDFIAGLRYPSIDHIQPLSKGGRHSWDNVQLAHMICNSLKSDKTTEPTPPPQS